MISLLTVSVRKEGVKAGKSDQNSGRRDLEKTEAAVVRLSDTAALDLLFTLVADKSFCVLAAAHVGHLSCRHSLVPA